jgi:hypothetical protein
MSNSANAQSNWPISTNYEIIVRAPSNSHTYQLPSGPPIVNNQRKGITPMDCLHVPLTIMAGSASPANANAKMSLSIPCDVSIAGSREGQRQQDGRFDMGRIDLAQDKRTAFAVVQPQAVFYIGQANASALWLARV